MCGLSGFIGFKNLKNPDEIIKLIGKALDHRGPDNGSSWVDFNSQIALYHNRLSIIDLDERSNQPIHSHSGRYVMIYNGEIYNFKNLKREIETYFYQKNTTIKWKTTSDTEVLLEGIEIWGLKNFVLRTEGMFSIAIFDKKKNCLSLCRDRFGEKPLYYGSNENSFFFCSELKALDHYPNFTKLIKKDSVINFIKYSQIAAPDTIYENVFKLMPGSIIEYSLSTKKINKYFYWSAQEVAENTNKIIKETDNYIDDFDHLIFNTVKRTVISDKPLAFFLSGGVDSTLIAGIANSFSSKKINTFTAGFENKKNFVDERHYAREIANTLNTNHDEFLIVEKDLYESVTEMPKIFCEPFGDSSQIPTYLISKKMRENFTVAISGDGGDEIFGGYYRNFNGYNTWNKIKKLNKIQKKIYILLLNIFNWSVPIEKIEYFFKKNNLEIFPTDLKLKINKLRSLFDQNNLSEYYSKLVSSDFSKKEFQNGKVMNNLLEKVTQSEISDYDKIMLLDINFYLTNDILTKVDRASMAASLEVRSPFLNHKIYEKSLTLPNELKFKNNTPKYILKKILNKYVPQHLFNRPKQGFEIPIEEWLLGSKKSYYRDIIFDKSTNLFEIIRYEKIFDKWKIFENGTVNYSKLFWNILMYQMWFKNNF